MTIKEVCNKFNVGNQSNFTSSHSQTHSTCSCSCWTLQQQLQSTTLHSSCCQSINCSLSTHCQLGRCNFAANNFLCCVLRFYFLFFFAWFFFFFLIFRLLLQTFLISCLAAVARRRCCNKSKHCSCQVENEIRGTNRFPNIWAREETDTTTARRTNRLTDERRKHKARRLWQKFENEAIYLYIWYRRPGTVVISYIRTHCWEWDGNRNGSMQLATGQTTAY